MFTIQEQQPTRPARTKPKIDLSKPKPTRAFELSRAAVVKKLLTSDKQSTTQQQAFVRGTVASKSVRLEGNKGDNLAYITDQKQRNTGQSSSSTPSPHQKSASPHDALKSKVSLKKDTPPPPSSNVPEPIPARIPRPKISKYGPAAVLAQSPDEEDEAADRLTPLRSEMRVLRSWPGSPKTGQQQHQQRAASYDNAATEQSAAAIRLTEGDG